MRKIDCTLVVLMALMTVPRVAAPKKGEKTTRVGMLTPTWTQMLEEHGSRQTSYVAAAATAAAAAAAATAIMAVKMNDASGWTHKSTASGSADEHSKGFRKPITSPIKLNRCVDISDAESEPEEYDNGDYESDDEQSTSRVAQKRPANTHLWSSKQFPEGTIGAANWDMDNLKAAQVAHLRTQTL